MRRSGTIAICLILTILFMTAWTYMALTRPHESTPTAPVVRADSSPTASASSHPPASQPISSGEIPLTETNWTPILLLAIGLVAAASFLNRRANRF